VEAACVAAVVAAMVVVETKPFTFPAEKYAMKIKYTMKALALFLLLAGVSGLQAAAPVVAEPMIQTVFSSPEDAGKALADAVRVEDVSALLKVVGPKAKNWLFSGDPVADRADWSNFLAAYEKKHGVVEAVAGKALLQVGDDGWTFPAPLIQKREGWVFDATAGREEFLNRRIGSNELSTIQTLLAVVDAQREYARGDLDGNGSHDYAQRIVSAPDKRDGLYWPAVAGQNESPLGPLVAAAALEGYGKKTGGKPAAYHGYHYRILKGQGKAAPGGAYSYLAGDRMIGGFAVLAYPASYGVSGVMSFVVSHDGTVYQKNLGKNTASVAAGMRLYAPDSGWVKAE